MKRLAAPALLIVTVLLASCADNLTIGSTAVLSQDIYRKHTVIYDSNEDMIYVRTRFSTGLFGPTIRLESGSIRMGGHPMEEAPTADRDHWDERNRRIEYRTKFQNRFDEESFEIVWHRPDGTLVRDWVSLPHPISITSPVDGEAYRRNYPLEIDWEGEALSSNETLGVFSYAPFSRKHEDKYTIPTFIKKWPLETLVLPGSSLYQAERVIQLARVHENAVSCFDSQCLSSRSVYLSAPQHIKLH